MLLLGLGACLGVPWVAVRAALGGLFWISGAPLGICGGCLGEPLEVLGRPWAVVWLSGSLQGWAPGKTRKNWEAFWHHFGRFLFAIAAFSLDVLSDLASLLVSLWELFVNVF